MGYTMKLDKTLYSTFDVVEKLKIKLERLRDWVKSGFIVPYKYGKSPRGKKAQFTHEQLYEIRLFQHMIENGIARKDAAFFLKLIPHVVNEKDEQYYKRMGKKPYVGIIPDFIIISRDKNGNHPEEAVYKDSIKLEKYKERDDIYILNYGKIKKEVDALP